MTSPKTVVITHAPSWAGTLCGLPVTPRTEWDPIAPSCERCRMHMRHAEALRGART